MTYKKNGRRPQTKMEDDQKKWKTTSKNKWKKTSKKMKMEDNLNFFLNQR